LTEKKDKLIEYKKGVMQQLFNGKWQDKDGQLIFIPPTLRFKADDGSEFPDWEERKLGDVLTIGNGRDYKHLSDGDIPVFGTGGYMTSVDGYLHDGETVFIGRKGTINKPYMFNGKFWTVDTLFYTKDFKDILPKFVYAIFQKVNWSLYNEATGVPSLSKSTINKIRLNLPSLSEQEKITEFISSLDQKIDLVNEELEKAKEWKRGLLQQMFV
ncbi:restriction endonuclease subunit S, partial [Vibrio parahaemolyticus]|nr:restriction endonuclease subunit S [Vibrio parahaemolyticus]